MKEERKTFKNNVLRRLMQLTVLFYFDKQKKLDSFLILYLRDLLRDIV